MKTNQILKVNFGKHELSIGHKDLLGNLNELIEIANYYRAQSGLSEFEAKKLSQREWFKSYVLMLENKELAKGTGNGPLEITDIKHVKNVLKVKRGKQGGTWAHLNILIRVAIEMSPIFADEVITAFIKGKILEYRDFAGDDFKILSKSIEVLNPSVMYRVQMAKGLNYIVFGKHYTNIRNNANEDQLQDLVNIQKKLAFAVDMGFIRSMEQLLSEMRKMYFMKNSNQLN